MVYSYHAITIIIHSDCHVSSIPSPIKWDHRSSHYPAVGPLRGHCCPWWGLTSTSELPHYMITWKWTNLCMYLYLYIIYICIYIYMVGGFAKKTYQSVKTWNHQPDLIYMSTTYACVIISLGNLSYLTNLKKNYLG